MRQCGGHAFVGIEFVECLRPVPQFVRNDVQHESFALRHTVADGESRVEHNAVTAFLRVLPDDQIDDAGFVFEGQDHGVFAVFGCWRLSTRPATLTIRPLPMRPLPMGSNCSALLTLHERNVARGSASGCSCRVRSVDG